MQEPAWTEESWDESADLFRIWQTIEPDLSDRRKWLLACALCRKIPGFLDSPSDHRNLIAAEEFIEGEDTLPMMLDSFGGTKWDIRFHRLHAAEAMSRCLESIWSEHEGDDDDYSLYATIIKEIGGNPFRAKRPIAFRGTPEIVSIAARIYKTKQFERVNEFAELLTESGCKDLALLEHLRRPQEHVRGCWALDELMGYHVGPADSV